MDFELEEAQWSAALPNALPGRLYLLEPGALAVQGLACASFPRSLSRPCGFSTLA